MGRETPQGAARQRRKYSLYRIPSEKADETCRYPVGLLVNHHSDVLDDVHLFPPSTRQRGWMSAGWLDLATGVEVRCAAKVLDLFDWRPALRVGLALGSPVRDLHVPTGAIVQVALGVPAA